MISTAQGRMAFAPLTAALTLASAMVLWAQQAQDWIPSAIALPSDMEVTIDRAIGSSTRIFAFVTGEDAGVLIDTWSEALSQSGYTIAPPSEEIETRQIEFSGPGIGNAKIAVQPTADADRSLVQFDASLN
jgi:hypothetical protein